ncbi:dynamin family protein [Aequorivita sinensis]|uniref:dynamin family protein n=1 Tax=Aequorivita sinensis TaxID=1382458 RepID=UPI00112203FB|nr:dynamin family protein [Aequorivita sinensis]
MSEILGIINRHKYIFLELKNEFEEIYFSKARFLKTDYMFRSLIDRVNTKISKDFEVNLQDEEFYLGFMSGNEGCLVNDDYLMTFLYDEKVPGGDDYPFVDFYFWEDLKSFKVYKEKSAGLLSLRLNYSYDRGTTIIYNSKFGANSFKACKKVENLFNEILNKPSTISKHRDHFDLLIEEREFEKILQDLEWFKNKYYNKFPIVYLIYYEFKVKALMALGFDNEASAVINDYFEYSDSHNRRYNPSIIDLQEKLTNSNIRNVGGFNNEDDFKDIISEVKEDNYIDDTERNSSKSKIKGSELSNELAEEIDEENIIFSEYQIEQIKKMGINIKYNTYSYGVEVDNFLNQGNGFEQSKNVIRTNHESSRIENWFYNFLEKYQEELNEEEFKINFTSTKYEIDIVNDIVLKFNRDRDLMVELISNEIDKTNLVTDFKEILTKIKNEKPDNRVFQYFEKNDLFSHLDEIDSAEVQIIVAATMSAGKSTLINALLGESLMPSKNEACTAVICKIKDIDGREGFSAVVKNNNNTIIRKIDNLDAESLVEINEEGNNEFLTIEIEGDIKNIPSENIHAVLVDTPGANNSQNEEHKKVTYNYIKDSEHKPLVLYVLNATALKINDDQKVLQEIAEFIKNKAGTTQDRFVFVLNKIDDFDHEKESLEDIIKSTQEYLTNTIGIENPKIFPISAEFARLALLEQSNHKLTRKEKSKLNDFRETFFPNYDDDYNGIDTIKYTPILERDKQILIEELNSTDELKESLHRSGISALQLYIKNYIENVHEIELGHDLLKDLPSHFNILRDDIKGLSDKQKKQIENDIKKILDSKELLSKKLSHTDEKLASINTVPSVIDNLRKRVNRDFLALHSNFKEKKATKTQALNAQRTASSTISNLKISLETSINNEIEEHLKKKWEEIINIINKDFKEYLNEMNLSVKTTNIISNNFNITLSSHSINSVKRTVAEKVGEEEISTSKWYNPFSWGTVEIKGIFQDKEYYDLPKLYESMGVAKLKVNFESNLFQVREDYKSNVNSRISVGKGFIASLEKNILEDTRKNLSRLQLQKTEINEASEKTIKTLETYLTLIERHK